MNSEDSMIQAGKKFLPGTRRSYLLQCHRREADPKARERLLAFLMRRDGMPIRQIAARLNRPYSTVRVWLLRASQMGIMGRYAERRTGAACRLSAGQLKQLRGELVAGPRECGFESGTWTCRIAAEHVRRRYGVEYRERGMWDLLDRLGFSCRRPGPHNPKSAPAHAREAFKKKQGRLQGTAPPGGMPCLPETSHRTS